MTVSAEGGRTRSLLSNEGLWVSILLVLALGLVLATAWDGLVDLYRRWSYEEEYGYGFLAVALVPILFWRDLPALLTRSDGNKWPGVAIVIFAQVLGVLGALGQSYFIEQIALALSALGIAFVVFGTGSFRVLLSLFSIVVLTIPMPYTLQAILTLKLQLISTEVGVAAIRLMGIPVFSEGNIIDLGSYKLQVAEACSGLRYLLPLSCISLIIAYLYDAPLWKRFIVFASAPIITVLINSFRIGVIGILVNRYGPQMAEGFLHQFEGWVVFLFGAALLVLVVLVLEGFRLRHVNFDLLPSGKVRFRKYRVQMYATPLAWVTLVATLAFAGTVFINWAHAHAPALSREPFSSFPSTLDAWNGREGRLEPDVLSSLKATDYYIGDFSSTPGSGSVNLFVAYYDALSKGAAMHSPRVCLPAAGWEFASLDERDFRELSPSTAGTYNRVVVQKGEDRILMYYWYDQRERRTANEFMMKVYLLLDSLRLGRSDGAIVRLYTQVGSGKSAMAAADTRLRAFAAAALPKLNNYLPK